MSYVAIPARPSPGASISTPGPPAGSTTTRQRSSRYRGRLPSTACSPPCAKAASARLIELYAGLGLDATAAAWAATAGETPVGFVARLER
jgi:hypothetical protein